MAFLDSEVTNDKSCTKTYLKNYETLKKQCDDLIVKLNQTKFKATNYKRPLAIVEEQLVTYKKNEVLFSEEVAVLKREVACKNYEINVLKSEFEKVKQEKEGIKFKIKKFDNASKSLDKLIESQITDNNKKGLGCHAVPPPHPLIYNGPTKLDLSYSGLDEFKEPKFKGYGPRDSKQESMTIHDKKSDVSKENSNDSFVKEQVSEDTSSFVESPLNVDKETAFSVDNKLDFIKPKNHDKPVKKSVSAQRNMPPKAVLLKTGLRPFNTARPVYSAYLKQTVHSARPMTHFSKQAQSTIQRPFYKQTTLTNRYFHQKANTVRPSVVYTARPYIAQANTVRAKRFNVVKASACWVWRSTRPNGASFVFKRHNYVDTRGKSKRMTGNITYLLDFKEFDGGYVTFGGGARGGRIYGKGTLNNDSIDFENVYFVNELKFNIFSVSQMCDKKNYVLFTNTECLVLSPSFKLPDESQILLKIPRKDNMYSFDIKNIVHKETLACLVAKATLDESLLWYSKLGHINFKNINKLVQDNLVRGLPIKRFENDQTCVVCLKGKQHRVSCKSKVLNPITKLLFMLHMDLFGLTFVSSLMHKKYCLVITDDYSRFSWVFFLATKDETNEILKNFIKEIENLVDKQVKIIKCDNGTEFRNKVMDDFCKEKGIKREYSIARTPQQNGVAERRNRTLIEAARTMGFKPALSFMRPFGCHVTNLNTFDNLGKFNGKSDEGFFVGYFLTGKAFRVYNTRTKKVEENLHIRFLEIAVGTISDKSASTQGDLNADGTHNKDDDKDKSDDDSSSKEVNAARQHVNTASVKVNNGYFELNTVNLSINTASSSDPHSPTDMFKLGASDSLKASHTRRMTKPTSEKGFLSAVYEVKTYVTLNTCLYACFLSQIKPTGIAKALSDSSWVEVMQEKLLQFKLQHVWILMDLPYGKKAIGKKMVFKNKKDERGIVIRNKERLVAHGHRQEEGIYYEEVFAPVARIEAIRLFLAYASFIGFLVYQMDVKSAFIYGTIEEEVYVTQPPEFKDLDHLDKVYKVVKVLYGLHQAPRAWYDTLANYLLSNGFQRGKIDTTLFIKNQRGDILLVQIYIDDIIFGSINKELCTAFEKLIKDKFQMSSIEELTFFLGLQVTQKEDRIFINQDKYVHEILKKFNYSDVRSASTPLDLEKPLVKDRDANDVDVHIYRSMIRSLMYLTTSRPDIMFTVCACARFQVTLKTSHLLVVKRIFRYLKGKPTLGLWYPRDSPFELVTYTDSDYAGATQNRKSTAGDC
nr:hypothetical protein [Tanacetum cinerariifolium]